MKIVVMGVSGCGKSTVADRIASVLGAGCIDGDDLHPPENIAHMAAGKPLNDAMRAPWLAECGRAMRDAGEVVLACSALKRSYRDALRAEVADLRIVYLKLSHSDISARLAARQGHFMPPELLQSQFDALEEPTPDEAASIVDGSQNLDAVVAAAIAGL